MASISKTASATRIKYSIIKVVDGEVQTEAQPDAVFQGIMSSEKAKRMLTKRLGKDVMFVITEVTTGQHRYVMDFETFIRNAKIEDVKPAEEQEQEPTAAAPEPAEEEEPEPDGVEDGEDEDPDDEDDVDEDE